MKARDLRDRSTEDLVELERSLTGERFQSKFKNFTNRLDDTSLIRKHKKDLARVKLILTERSRGITVVYKQTDESAPKPKTRAPKPAETEATSTAESTETAEKSAKTAAKAKAPKSEAKGTAEKKAKASSETKTAAKKPKASAKGETK